jgi:hypothetical protein
MERNPGGNPVFLILKSMGLTEEAATYKGRDKYVVYG